MSRKTYFEDSRRKISFGHVRICRSLSVRNRLNPRVSYPDCDVIAVNSYSVMCGRPNFLQSSMAMRYRYTGNITKRTELQKLWLKKTMRLVSEFFDNNGR